jgi:hypothetical protein
MVKNSSFHILGLSQTLPPLVTAAGVCGNPSDAQDFEKNRLTFYHGRKGGGRKSGGWK